MSSHHIACAQVPRARLELKHPSPTPDDERSSPLPGDDADHAEDMYMAEEGPAAFVERCAFTRTRASSKFASTYQSASRHAKCPARTYLVMQN